MGTRFAKSRRHRAAVVVAADVVVIGGGVAGLAAALALADRWRQSGRRIVVLSKTPFALGGNSWWAQGGVAAALGGDDSPELHARDTVAVAGGLADEAAVAQLVGEGRWRVLELIARGARFDRDAGGGLQFGREAAHSRRRIVHADGDATGREMVRTLAAAVSAEASIEVIDRCEVLELLQGAASSQPSGPSATPAETRAGAIAGLIARRADGKWLIVRTGAVVLATGGMGQVYHYTTNPAEASGDGLALAARAGAVLVDLEMVQFHPTALAPLAMAESDGSRPGVSDSDESDQLASQTNRSTAASDGSAAAFASLPLLTEALRGEGALLVDGKGERFMVQEHPLAELAPRDVVARAIAARVDRGEVVYLDVRPLGPRVAERFPSVTAACRERGLEPSRDLLPVVAAAHYHMGGVAVDGDGRTNVPGLWACGEVAASGAHGANRLASNSLLEALVWGARVGEDVARSTCGTAGLLGPLALEPAASREASRLPVAATGQRAIELERELRRRMHAAVGVARDRAGLIAVLRDLDTLGSEADVLAVARLDNLLLVARLIATAALAREESRGAHLRLDYPQADSAWAHRLCFCLEPNGTIAQVASLPVATPAAAAPSGVAAASSSPLPA